MRHVMRLGGAAALLTGLALLVTACARPAPAEDMQSRVNDALKDARIDHVAPAWDPQRRELRLRGIVLTPDEKALAEEVAGATIGPNGTVISELTITMRGAPEPAPVVNEVDDLEQIDERIRSDVEALFADERVWKGRTIHIVVREGTVQLTGTALSQEDKDRMTEMVARVAGVTNVINRLELKAAKPRT